jgi:hypothetical protein
MISINVLATVIKFLKKLRNKVNQRKYNKLTLKHI